MKRGDETFDDAWDDESLQPTEEAREPSVRISMGDAGSNVRPPPRRYETMRPFEEDHWTPGVSAAQDTMQYLGIPQPPKLPESLRQPVELPRDIAKGSTDLPVIADPVADTNADAIDAIDAIEELEALRRRTRRRVIGVAIAAPILLGLAFFLGRRPQQEAPAATSPQPRAQPVVTAREPVVQPVSRERSLAESLLERAEIAIRNGRIAAPPGDNALEFLLDAEKLEPGSPRAKTVRAEAVKQLLAAAAELWKAGKPDSARTMYSDALLFDPTIEIAKQRARTARVATEPPSRDIAWLVAEIDLAIIERRLVAPSGRNALELLQQLRRVDPTNEVAKRLGGEIAAAITTAAKARPTDAKLQAATKPAKLEEPKPPVETEKPRDPVLARELVTKGNSALGAGRLADARASFERAIAADSGAHAALAGLGEVAYHESDYTRSVLAAKRAIALAPTWSGYRMLLGKAYYKLLRYDDAIKQWQKALELDPKNTAAQKNIEMARHRMGR